MIEIFHKGGPIMWPLLAVSVVVLAVVIERFLFIVIERKNRDERLVGEILAQIEKGHLDQASRIGGESKDFVVRAVTYALTHREKSFSEAMLRAANRELKRFNRGLTILDTATTLAPLLGLLGTVIGMIEIFGSQGGSLGSAVNAASVGATNPQQLAHGISIALYNTAFGLLIAIPALAGWRILRAIADQRQRECEECTRQLFKKLYPEN